MNLFRWLYLVCRRFDYWFNADLYAEAHPPEKAPDRVRLVIDHHDPAVSGRVLKICEVHTRLVAEAGVFYARVFSS